MKVCTDACILGAYAEVENAQRILDIGAGTGLLSLMTAQRTEARIDAIEIDYDAYQQALINISESKFAHKINISHQSIQLFTPADGLESFDVIVSNPPFYQNSLQSPDTQVNKALHAATLSLDELMESATRLLKPNGQFIVLLPPFESKTLATLAQKKHLSLSRELSIRHDSTKPVFRVISTYIKAENHNAVHQQAGHEEDILDIYNTGSNVYSDKFRELLRDYYIIF